jgi:hypothetical protein
MQTKHCRCCKNEKDITGFGKDRYKKDGLRTSCKICDVSIRRKSYLKNRKNRVASSVKWKMTHMKEFLEYQKQLRRRHKMTLIKGYGGKCTCCGETILEFLTLEHKNKDGKIHRKTKGCLGSMGTYRDIIRRGFPNECTILCMNCNYAERYGHKCPHKALKLAGEA